MPKYVAEALVDIYVELNDDGSSAFCAQPVSKSSSKMGNLATCLRSDHNREVVISRGVQCGRSRLYRIDEHPVGRRPLIRHAPETESEFSSSTDSVLWHQSRQHNRNTNAYLSSSSNRVNNSASNRTTLKYRYNGCEPELSHSQIRDLMKRDRLISNEDPPKRSSKRRTEKGEEYSTDEISSTSVPRRTSKSRSKVRVEGYKINGMNSAKQPVHRPERHDDKFDEEYWDDEKPEMKKMVRYRSKCQTESMDEEDWKDNLMKAYRVSKGRSTVGSQLWQRQTSQNNAQSFSDKMDSTMETESETTPIMTDKAMYKPGSNQSLSRVFTERKRLYNTFNSLPEQLHTMNDPINVYDSNNSKLIQEPEFINDNKKPQTFPQRDICSKLQTKASEVNNGQSFEVAPTKNKANPQNADKSSYVFFSKGSEENTTRLFQKNNHTLTKPPEEQKVCKGTASNQHPKNQGTQSRSNRFKSQKSNANPPVKETPPERLKAPKTKIPTISMSTIRTPLKSKTASLMSGRNYRMPTEHRWPPTSNRENLVMKTPTKTIRDKCNPFNPRKACSHKSLLPRMSTRTPETEPDRDSLWGHFTPRRGAPSPSRERHIHRFFLPESAAVENIIADPNDRRIKAICDRLGCDIDIYPKVAHGGFLKNLIVIGAPQEESLRKCVRTLDNSLHWCLSSQLR